ncbi:hypothetical protein LG21E20_18040 [Lactococcus formosensis]|nr:Macrolide export ATP-binding/permease protein MacB [Lactococcus formosensis]BDW50142.1 hypothetical protein LG21E20_18040 [Lactococcus formosensis]BDX25731.1 hypothetical protein LFMS200408A_18080 [Lactococcus formosensis]
MYPPIKIKTAGQSSEKLGGLLEKNRLTDNLPSFVPYEKSEITLIKILSGSVGYLLISSLLTVFVFSIVCLLTTAYFFQYHNKKFYLVRLNGYSFFETYASVFLLLVFELMMGLSIAAFLSEISKEFVINIFLAMVLNVIIVSMTLFRVEKKSLIKSLKGKVMNKNEIVSLSNIQKKIQDNPIFSINAFTVNKGDFVTIKGVSGSGKTTLLNILGMNDTVSSGEYLFEGVETEKLKAKEKLKIKRNKISFLFQDFGLVEEETINFNLEIGLKYSKLSRKEKVKQKKEALNAVNLNKKLFTTISSLSGGEKQRVALARIILKPSILILADEPTGSLDSLNRDIVTDILFQQAIEGKAVIIVTHDEELAKKGNKTIEL